MTELEKRLEALEKRAGKVTRPEHIEDVPLVKCNELAQREWAKAKAEKKSAENVAVEAIQKAFKTQSGKTQHRAQKNISGAVHELAARTK